MGVPCHYCGRTYGDAESDAPQVAALRRHLLEECPEVPAPVRQQYDRPCPSGRCPF